MNNTIKHTFFYSHPPQAVWDYLTNSELIEQWLMKNDFEPVIGRDFQFTTRPLPQFNFDGIAYCKVLELVPLKKLTYSWKGGPGGGEITLDSIVEWTLQAREDGTELTLNHSGFKEANFNMFAAMDAGWAKNIRKIADLIIASTHGTAGS